MPLWAHPTSRSILKDAPAFVLPGRERAMPSTRSAPSTRRELLPSAQQARTTRPPGIPPFRTTRPLETPPRPHDTSAGNSPSPARHSNFSLPHDKARRELLPPARHVRRSPPLPHDTSAGNSPSPARHTNFSLPHDKAPATPDRAAPAKGRFTASFCRFTDRADSPLPEQPCSIWDFSYLCTLPSHEPHFSSP